MESASESRLFQKSLGQLFNKRKWQTSLIPLTSVYLLLSCPTALSAGPVNLTSKMLHSLPVVSLTERALPGTSLSYQPSNSRNLDSTLNKLESFYSGTPRSDQWDHHSQDILNTLLQHLEDNSLLRSDYHDLENLAAYYAKYPMVYRLFQKLSGKRWTLMKTTDAFSTEITISDLSVNHIRVKFNLLKAAQYRFNKACKHKRPFCIASPADVLLHELIHVDNIINQTNRYIQRGGLDPYLYPFAHERDAIEQEQKLYRAMSAIDQLPRPYRTEHIGDSIHVRCATCLQ